MHATVPPRIPIKGLSTKNPKWKEIVEKLNEAGHSGEASALFQEREEDSSGDEEMSDKEDNFLWDKLVSKADKNSLTIFECLKVYLHLYYNLASDTVYQKIMEDVDDDNFSSTLDDAIEKNRDFIVKSVEKCRQNLDDDEILNIFGGMARKLDVPEGCAWFTGLKCYCDECNGTSLLSRFRNFALIFHAMENDDVIENILDIVREIDPDEEDFEDAVDQAIEQNKVSIIEKCNEATSRLNVHL